MPLETVRAMAPVGLVAERLSRAYPDARTELEHSSALELLVATVLSAQATDAGVNAVTPELWRRWPDAPALAGAPQAEVEEVLRPIGLAPTKARRIIALADDLRRLHGGEVPQDRDALEALPGVGRKTASVVLGVWFGEGALAVDTHVARLSRRLGWTEQSDPARVERDVLRRIAANATTEGAPLDLTALSLRLILHGRRVCTARAPRCAACTLADVCPSAGTAA